MSGLHRVLLDELLLHTTRIEVVRMAVVLSQHLQLHRATIARAHRFLHNADVV